MKLPSLFEEIYRSYEHSTNKTQENPPSFVIQCNGSWYKGLITKSDIPFALFVSNSLNSVGRCRTTPLPDLTEEILKCEIFREWKVK